MRFPIGKPFRVLWLITLAGCARASTLDTSVTLNQRIGSASYQLLQFTTHADSGNMPGAAVMEPATSFLADKTATQIVDSVAGYFAQHGWAS